MHKQGSYTKISRFCVRNFGLKGNFLDVLSQIWYQLEKWGFERRYPGSSSMMKKTKTVQKQINVANRYLQKYEDQLFTISAHFNINFEKQIKNLEAFLDRFVDDLITDWVVNNKIQRRTF